MKKKLISSCTLLLVATILFNVFAISAVFSQEPVEIYVEPPEYVYDTAVNGTVGTLFNVTVKVRNIDDVKTWQLRVYFDDSIINVTKWYEPKWDPTYVFYGRTTLPIPGPSQVTYTHLGPGNGSAGVGVSLFPAPSAGNGFTGDGILCIMTFNITAIPYGGDIYTTELALDKPAYTFWIKAGESDKRAYDVYTNGQYTITSPAVFYDATIDAYCLTDGIPVNVDITQDGTPSGFVTPHTFTDLLSTHNFTVPSTDLEGHPFREWNTGEPSTTITINSDGVYTAYYGELPPAKLYVDPPEIIDPTMVPSTTFHINITIDDVENMVVCQFNLTYDPSVITWFSIGAYRVQGQLPWMTVEADALAGYIWLRLVYGTPITTIDPAPLVRIEFHVEALGATPLDLTDTELLDPEDDPIPHQAIDGFFMTLIRDVAVINIALSHSWAYAGWPVDVVITVKNLGNIAETFDVTAYYDGNIIDTTTVTDLAPDAETIVTITWDTTGVSADTYTIKAEADTVPYEVDTTNNVYIDGMVVILTEIRDVAVTDIVHSYTWVYQGWLVDINVTAENLGELTEDFDVTLYYDGNPIGVIHVAGLAPMTAIDLTFTWDTTLVEPCHNYTISAEASEVPYEYDTTNNAYSDGKIKVRYMGDINGDGAVDMSDIQVLLDAFLSYPGHPLWQPAADLNRDDLVDMADIALAIENFLKSCP